MNKKTLVALAGLGLVVLGGIAVAAGARNNAAQAEDASLAGGPVKEITMKSFVEFVDGKPMPQFDPKEITVNKGDRVRIKVTNIKGNHNFNLDEFGIHAETPPDQEVVVEFAADKAGDFIYYCSKPGHRQAGHWGTLKVRE